MSKGTNHFSSYFPLLYLCPIKSLLKIWIWLFFLLYFTLLNDNVDNTPTSPNLTTRLSVPLHTPRASVTILFLFYIIYYVIGISLFIGLSLILEDILFENNSCFMFSEVLVLKHCENTSLLLFTFFWKILFSVFIWIECFIKKV